MASITQKSPRVARNVQTHSEANAGGKTFRLPLNRDSLLEEFVISVALSQMFTVANPTLSDVRRLFSNVSLETNIGTLIGSVNLFPVYDIGRFTESTKAPRISLGAFGATPATADFSFEIHFELDDLDYDALSYLRSTELTQLDLVLTVAADAQSVFYGAGTAGQQNVSVTVESNDYPDMLEDEQFGSLMHYMVGQTANGNTTGEQQPIRLALDNATRFVAIHTFDTTGATPVPTNAVIGNVRLVIGGVEKRVTTFKQIQWDNINRRGIDLTGFAVLDWGNNLTSLLDLYGVNEALLKYDVMGGAPASYRVLVTQDYVKS